MQKMRPYFKAFRGVIFVKIADNTVKFVTILEWWCSKLQKLDYWQTRRQRQRRDGQTGRERERERKQETDKQTWRQIHKQTETQTIRREERQTNRQKPICFMRTSVSLSLSAGLLFRTCCAKVSNDFGVVLVRWVKHWDEIMGTLCAQEGRQRDKQDRQRERRRMHLTSIVGAVCVSTHPTLLLPPLPLPPPLPPRCSLPLRWIDTQDKTKEATDNLTEVRQTDQTGWVWQTERQTDKAAVYLSVCVFVCLSVYLSACVCPLCLFICPSVCLCLCVSACLFICLYVSWQTKADNYV